MSAAANGRSAPGAPVLEVRDLRVTFPSDDGPVHAVRGVDLTVTEHEVLGVVGESGSGKTVTMLAVMGLLPRQATVEGSVRFAGRELLALPARELRGLRGGDLAMVFQDPMTALNPVLTVGVQVAETVVRHQELDRHAARRRAVELLGEVGVPEPERRVDQYPHELSGGLRQRVLIAMAIANGPRLLVADEPTTALDVTIQAQVLEVLEAVQERTGAAVVLVTHDLGVVARLARRVAVMYAGQVVERAEVDTLFSRPRHPYTSALLRSLPRAELVGRRLAPVAGSPPSLVAPPSGCPFHPRCPHARARCVEEVPALRDVGAGQRAACHFAEELAGEARA